MEDKVYKIFTETEWNQFRKTGRFRGSADDLRDGFIHLSSSSQVDGVVAKFFAGRDALHIAEFCVSDFKDDLIWEKSASGELYPHLYGCELLFGQCSKLIDR